MIEIQRMNLNDTKDINPIGHVGEPSKIKEEHPNTFLKNNTEYLTTNQEKQKLNN